MFCFVQTLRCIRAESLPADWPCLSAKLVSPKLLSFQSVGVNLGRLPPDILASHGHQRQNEPSLPQGQIGHFPAWHRENMVRNRLERIVTWKSTTPTCSVSCLRRFESPPTLLARSVGGVDIEPSLSYTDSSSSCTADSGEGKAVEALAAGGDSDRGDATEYVEGGSIRV